MILNPGAFPVVCPAGTLTQNEMIFKRLHLGTVSYGTDTMDEIQSHIIQSYGQVTCIKKNAGPPCIEVRRRMPLKGRTRRENDCASACQESSSFRWGSELPSLLRAVSVSVEFDGCPSAQSIFIYGAPLCIIKMTIAL